MDYRLESRNRERIRKLCLRKLGREKSWAGFAPAVFSMTLETSKENNWIFNMVPALPEGCSALWSQQFSPKPLAKPTVLSIQCLGPIFYFLSNHGYTFLGSFILVTSSQRWNLIDFPHKLQGPKGEKGTQTELQNYLCGQQSKKIVRQGPSLPWNSV